MVQAENEYTLCAGQTGYRQVNNTSVTALDSSCLDKEYMVYVQRQLHEAGVVVPIMVNDAFPVGNFAPGTGLGEANIYTFDNYPLYWSTARMFN
jgi:beta-galactosidase